MSYPANQRKTLSFEVAALTGPVQVIAGTGLREIHILSVSWGYHQAGGGNPTIAADLETSPGGVDFFAMDANAGGIDSTPLQKLSVTEGVAVNNSTGTFPIHGMITYAEVPAL